MFNYHVVILVVLMISAHAFQSRFVNRRVQLRQECILKASATEEPVSEFSADATAKAMAAARQCAAKGLSPGAGLETADEQSDAAYADLINTSVDQRGIELSKNDLKELNKGGKMWEKGATTGDKRKLGLLSDLGNVFKALSGGAHIEKNKFGETWVDSYREDKNK